MTKELITYIVNAFTNSAFNGNATGVVIDSVGLTDDEMSKIAKDLKQHETVFVKKMDVNRYSTRFFTDKGEIDLCGHATIATFYALAKEEYIIPIDRGTVDIIQHSRLGKIPVKIEYKNEEVLGVSMLLDVKEIETSVTKEEMAKVLGISPEDMDLQNKNLPIKKLTSGICDIVVPIKDRETLSKISLNYDLATEMVKREEALSILALTTRDGKTVYSRTFSPGLGIEEEPASGTSALATLKYLRDLGLAKDKIESAQGTSFGRIGSATAEYIEESGKIKVTGGGFVFLTGVLKI
ncbi:PhzF family phenazine biosynthesis protein [Peptoniphilus duerdenii]|uniref:PhzF family phenazine biosynthesis protein n=1 Tax=Peptoniphilus duerdenii TaxID=507750 RepID=UPI0023F56264|nr:PhzF family phenazine biosynthesis protein [Peptoniphilus duerdenii]